MRKVTTEAAKNFLAGSEWKKDNTDVQVREYQNAPGKWVILLLHGNPIARYRLGDTSLRSLRVCDGGWQTRTTAERLNGLPGVRVNQKAGQWYLNGEKWDGSWSTVAPQYTITAEEVDNAPRWRVDFPTHGHAPIFFPSLAAAEAFVAVEESNMRAA